MERTREIKLSDQTEDDLRADLRALHAMTHITGSTPDMTRLIRKARQAQITAIETELARRKREQS
jgi:hypothetical protein